MANDIGGFEGSVEAFAGGGIGADLGNIEASMSASNGGGLSETATVGGLDLDPVIGSPIAVMDSRIDDPAPSFIAHVTNAEAKVLGSSFMLAGAATAAVLTGGATAGFLTGAAIISFGTNLEALANATMDAQSFMGRPGAFVTSTQSYTATGDWMAGGEWSADQSVAWYAQWTPDSGSGGGGPG